MFDAASPTIDILPALYVMAGPVVLATWEGDGDGVKALPRIEGQSLPAPILTIALSTTWGATRTLVAFRPPPAGARIEFAAADGTVVATAGATSSLPRLQPSHLIDGLRPAEQVRALRFVLQSCRAAFGLGSHPAFSQLCRQLVAEMAPQPAALAPRADICRDLVLCEGRLAVNFGRVAEVIVLGAASVRRNAHLPTVGATGRLRLVIETKPEEGELSVVLLGDDSLACRTVELRKPRVRLLPWLETLRPDNELREYVGACLARAADDNAAAGAALREMQLLFPLAKVGVTMKAKPVGGEIDLAVSHGAGGLFVSGWLHDPHELIESITSISATGRRVALSAPMYRFPRPDVGQHYGHDNHGAAGFATFVPQAEGSDTSYQHRFELALRSGELLHVVAPPQPVVAAEARNAVLGSMPPPYVSSDALANCIGPAAASLHALHLSAKKTPEVVDFGTPPALPTVSVVVPLYKVLDFVRFQLAAFAVDPMMAEAELIYVLDSPEQRDELQHLLRGLHALYQVPVRLVVMPANYGFAAASNAGAAVGRAPTVLFLNSDVIPDGSGWLQTLLGALIAEKGVGAVGPKLLFDDESLQHAGMYFDRDLTGHWYNLHYHKGLPRYFPPACIARTVPAVTGACLLMRRTLIESLGGFSEDYIIGDYEDSDLCLRLRQEGLDIGYVPQSELFHLERQSIQRHTGYTRGVACAYNRRLHAERWGWMMAELRGEGPKAAA